MRIQCISRRGQHLSRPTTGMLFSAWQAATQAPQPMQVLRLIAMPQALPSPSSCALLAARLVDEARPAAAVLLVDLGEILVLVVGLQVGDPNQVAAVHPMVVLGGRQAIGPGRLDDLEARVRTRARRRRERIDVDPDLVADPAGTPTPVAQRDGDRILGLARQDVGRNLQPFPAIPQLDGPAPLLGLLDPELPRQGRADGQRAETAPPPDRSSRPVP